MKKYYTSFFTLGISLLLWVFICSYANGANTTCVKHAKIDLYYLQDDTASFNDDMPALKSNFPKILADLQAEFPDSQFGAGVFSDSNRPARVNYGQYCYKQLFKFSKDYTPIINYIQNVFRPTKGDSERAEDSLSAMTVAALDDNLGWRPFGRDPVDGRLVIPVIMVITDALFQYTRPVLPGLSSVGGGPSPGYEPRTGQRLTVDYVCTTNDYATLLAAKTALTNRKITPLILSVADTLPGWKLLLDYLELGGIVGKIATDSANIVEAVKKALDSIVCEAEEVAGTEPPLVVPSPDGGSNNVEPEPDTSAGAGAAGTGVALGAASGGALLLAAGGYAAYRKLAGGASSALPESYFDPGSGSPNIVEKDVMNTAVESDFA